MKHAVRRAFPSNGRPVVVAHRGGAWPGSPGEQTLAHFERAATSGADYIEVDLRLTADGRIVCVHDAEYAGRRVAAVGYEELAAASATGAGRPALLSELLEVARGRIRLDLELKVGGFEEQVLAEVRAGFDPADVIYKSFDDGVVRRLKGLSPESVAGLLLGVPRPRHGVVTRVTELFPELRLLRCGADFVSPNWRLLRAAFVYRMRRLGYPVLVWTVNEAALLARCAMVDGIVTDRVADALAVRCRRPAAR